MKMLLITLTTLASAFAMAKGTNEYFFQPSAGGNAVDIGYGYANLPVKDENKLSGTETKNEETMGDLVVHYQYGLNESNALGVYTFVGSEKVKTDTDSHSTSGMGDIHLTYKGFMDVWHYGADLGVNTAKQKFKTNGNLDNRSTGGMSLDLDFGGLWASNGWNYGAKADYIIMFERTIDDPAVANEDIKVTEGNTARIAGFGEYNYGHGFFGGELSYNMKADQKSKVSGTTTTEKADNFLGVMLYGTYDFTEMVEGLLSIQENMHSKHDASDTTSVKAYAETDAFVGVRLNF
jgi:hypothetical protein